MTEIIYEGDREWNDVCPIQRFVLYVTVIQRSITRNFKQETFICANTVYKLFMELQE